jgi:hypothetical protein
MSLRGAQRRSNLPPYGLKTCEMRYYAAMTARKATPLGIFILTLNIGTCKILTERNISWEIENVEGFVVRSLVAGFLFFRLLSFLSAPSSLRSALLYLGSEPTGEGQDPTVRNKANFADGGSMLTTVESKGNWGERLIRLLGKQSQFAGVRLFPRSPRRPACCVRRTDLDGRGSDSRTGPGGRRRSVRAKQSQFGQRRISINSCSGKGLWEGQAGDASGRTKPICLPGGW